MIFQSNHKVLQLDCIYNKYYMNFNIKKDY